MKKIFIKYEDRNANIYADKIEMSATLNGSGIITATNRGEIVAVANLDNITVAYLTEEKEKKTEGKENGTEELS